jgi:hypothetical protein
MDEPIAYWRFGDAARARVAADEMGKHPGDYQGDVTGMPGALASDTDNLAAQFDGVGAYVDIGDEPAATTLEFIGTAPFSIEAWIHPNDVSGPSHVVCKRHDLVAPEDDGYALYISDAGKLVLTRVGAGNFDSIETDIAAQQWTHVVATYDGITMRLFLDGGPTAATEEPSDAELPDVDEPLRIGSRSMGALGGEYFGGLIDEVAIYDKALEYQRIGAHFDAAQ